MVLYLFRITGAKPSEMHWFIIICVASQQNEFHMGRTVKKLEVMFKIMCLIMSGSKRMVTILQTRWIYIYIYREREREKYIYIYIYLYIYRERERERERERGEEKRERARERERERERR